MKCKIKYKLSIGILAVLISIVMLMSNALATGGPPVWVNQATLSTIDSIPAEDPEISGFGTIKVVVWEEEVAPNTHDIYMKFSLLDGILGSWVFPPVQPATTNNDEINPAVTVTNVNPITFAMEIHVVYQVNNGGQWDVEHTWTNNFGIAWTAPIILDSTAANDAIDPAVVYTEDLNNPGVGFGMLVQFTWSEFNPAPGGTNLFEIQYDAYYQDPTLVPLRGYVGVTLIRAGPGDCFYPEIASVDERISPLAFDYYFAIVWEEQTAAGQWNVWYIDGTTTTSPAIIVAPNFLTMGQLNPVNPAGEDCYDPDIAATQDYQNPETYYFHVDWVHYIPAGPGGPQSWQIDTCYYAGILTNPGAAAFVLTAPARGPTNIVLDRPTIASKLIGLAPTVFETWMCWEDNSVPGSSPDIWYRMGQYTVGVPPFVYMMVAAIRVPYAPPFGSTEFNPELWNRNDITWMFPLNTHLVFDSDANGATREIEYIDP